MRLRVVDRGCGSAGCVQEKALLQSRRASRQAAAQLQKAQAMNVRQAAVVKRKTEEVQAAQKRWHVSPRPASAARVAGRSILRSAFPASTTTGEYRDSRAGPTS